MAPENSGSLPTLKQWIEGYLGFELPGLIPLPQTRRNADKALAKVILAAAENVEARVRSGTQQVKARGKIALDEMNSRTG